MQEIKKITPQERKNIARDKDGCLAIFEVLPKKEANLSWWGIGMADNFAYFTPFNHLFQSIKWTDEQPCEFRKFI